MEKEKYIITGATGHIGNVLARKLCEQNKDVTAFVLPNEDLTPIKDLNLNIVDGDITEREAVFKVIVKDSVEEKILNLQMLKKDLFNLVIGNEQEFVSKLTLNELLSLFND